MSSTNSHRQFEPGDRATDGLATPEVDPVRVVDPDVGRASEVESDGQPVVEYEGNEQFGADATVVAVVYEYQLNKLVPGWGDFSTARFDDELSAYEEKWGVQVTRYPFPADRLEQIPDDTGSDTVTSDRGGGDTATSEEVA
jgi:hypothetical protein